MLIGYTNKYKALMSAAALWDVSFAWKPSTSMQLGSSKVHALPHEEGNSMGRSPSFNVAIQIRLWWDAEWGSQTESQTRQP